MKRRVLRTHNNKKALRTIQAAHNLKEPHHVLCDESFLRTVVGHRDLENVRVLIADCVGSCVVHVLPETLRNLERHGHYKAWEHANQYCVVVQDENPATSSAATATSAANSTTKPTADAATSSEAPVGRNELKAIAATLRAPVTNRSRFHPFYFVATQNHDLRRMLDASTPIVRATFNPTSAWLEVNREVQGGQRSQDNKPASSSDKAGSQFSNADAAFMKSLGLEERNGRVVKPRPVNPRYAARAAEAAAAAAAASATSDGTDVAGQPPIQASTAIPRVQQFSAQQKKQNNKPKGPNPLSMKKKSQRETFSIDTVVEPPKTKRRVE